MWISRIVHASITGAALAATLVVATARPSAQEAAVPAAVVIVHPGVQVASLTLDQFRDVLLGDQQHWQGGARITVLRPASGVEWATVLARALRLSPLTYDRRMANKLYSGELSALPRLVSSATEMRRLVATTPGSVGVIPQRDIDNSVKVLRLNGLLPQDAGYPLIAQ